MKLANRTSIDVTFVGSFGLVTALGILLLLGPTNVLAEPDACYVAPEGLVSWWPGEGNALDSEHLNDGTLELGVSFASGVVGQAFSFDGIDDYVLVPPSTSLELVGDVSVMAWFKPSYLTPRDGFPGMALIWKGAGGHGTTDYVDWPSSYYLSHWANKYRGGFEAPTDSSGNAQNYDVLHTPLITDTEWHHLAYVRSGQMHYIYVNGTLTASTGFGSAPGSAESLPLTIGVLYEEPMADYKWHFEGLVDEVAVFNRALEEHEVAGIYESGGYGMCADEDGDGYRPPEDCDESQAGVNPAMAELPGNFVDENCDGSLGDCDPCFPWRNHGEYVRCVSHAIEDLVTNGDIIEEDGDELVSSAARSDIGKKHYVAPECQ